MSLDDDVRDLRRRLNEALRLLERLPVIEAQHIQRGTYLYGQLTENAVAGTQANCKLGKCAVDGSFIAFEDLGILDREMKIWPGPLVKAGYMIPAEAIVRIEREPHTGFWIISNANECVQPAPPPPPEE